MCRAGGRRCKGVTKEIRAVQEKTRYHRARTAALLDAGDTDAAAVYARRAELAQHELRALLDEHEGLRYSASVEVPDSVMWVNPFVDGYDSEGFSQKGYDRDRFDRAGYHADPPHLNRVAYDREGRAGALLAEVTVMTRVRGVWFAFLRGELTVARLQQLTNAQREPVTYVYDRHVQKFLPQL